MGNNFGTYLARVTVLTIVGVSLLFAGACASTNSTPVDDPKNDNLAVKRKSVACKDKKNKVLVYPPNDGFGGSLSQGASGKPTEYCDEDDLMRQKPNLVPKAESN